jgi:hypothetical protein
MHARTYVLVRSNDNHLFFVTCIGINLTNKRPAVVTQGQDYITLGTHTSVWWAGLWYLTKPVSNMQTDLMDASSSNRTLAPAHYGLECIVAADTSIGFRQIC